MDTHRMKRSSNSSLLWVIAAAFMAYVGGYVAYRFAGPAQKVWPKSGDGQHALLLVSTETPLRTGLYYVFYPCIAVESAYYRSRPD